MRYALLVTFVLAFSAGCAKKDEAAGASSPAQAESAAGQDQRAANPGLFMAYERSIALDVEESRVAEVARSVEEACRQAADAQCVILASQLETGSGAYASVRMRARPDGIRKIATSLSKHGEVVSESVTGEDLAAPIADSAKRLEMLTDYRARLESLRGRASNDIEALIKVNQELAQVQSEIETLTGTRAHLLQRVATETLTVSIRSQGAGFWRPIGEATTEFGDNLSYGISTTITAIAFLLPWLVLLTLLFWTGRRLWSWRRRARSTVAK